MTGAEWLFRSRVDGRITVAQAPNAALGLFLAATVVRLVLRPSGTPATALTVVSTAALVAWAGDEVVRGVNPWRRLLGGGVLVWRVAALVVP